MRLNPAIRLWSGGQLAVAGLLALFAAGLLVTAAYVPSAPYLGRWLALSAVVLWVCAMCTWFRRRRQSL
jgi:hypothetical protein